MRLTSSHGRQANRHAAPPPKPRNRVVKAFARVYGTVSGQRQRDAERAREQWERLDVDQRVRSLGEW
jgi:hypothetical protein